MRLGYQQPLVSSTVVFSEVLEKGTSRWYWRHDAGVHHVPTRRPNSIATRDKRSYCSLLHVNRAY